LRINERITAAEARVVDDAGENLGVMPTSKARDLAREKGLDLIEVAPQANPPVCRIADYGKYQYQQEKRDRKQRRRTKLKEVKFTIKIGEHDFETKVNRARDFLSHGDMVRVSIFFRGREVVHASRGREMLKRVEEKLSDIARAEGQPSAKGRILQMMLVPTQQG
jgi:translation initiation factor IF-3